MPAIAPKIASPEAPHQIKPEELGDRAIVSRLKRFLSLSLLDNRFPALHGLRLIAIVFVIVSHNNAFLSTNEIEINRRFWLGMDFFFIMSGFLIGNILLHDAKQTGWRHFVRFYARRSFRILPAYYATLVLLALRQIRSAGWANFNPLSLPKEFLFFTNYPFDNYLMPWSWSLSLEEHFYFVSPFLLTGLFLFRKTLRIPVLLALFFVPFALRLFFVQSGEDFFVKIFTPTHFRFDPLIMGVLIAYLRKTYPTELQRLVSHPRISSALFPTSVALVLTMILTFSLPLPYAEGSIAHPVLVSFYCGTLTSFAFGLLILWVMFSKDKLNRWLGAPICRAIATLGYGVYLIHIPAIALVGRFLPMPWLPTLVCGVLLSGVYAYLLHIFLEKPLFKLRDRLTNS